LTGPLVIHGPSSANWDIDLGPLPITDYYHKESFTEFYEQRVGFPKPSDNALFNGMNTFNNSGVITGSKFEMKFTPGKKHRIRLVNMATDAHFKFSVDNHKITVMAADFVAIEPYVTEVVHIFIGMPIPSFTDVQVNVMILSSRRTNR
jgi:FtsP/CotA-like multicopper oxidase with cupredoxin domain